MAGRISKWVSRKRAQRLAKKGKLVTTRGTKVKEAAYSKKAMARKAAAGDKTGTGEISRGAVSGVATRGGTFVKYKKDSKAAGNFRSAFKAGCAGGKKSFSWQGRSYACKKA